MIPHVPHGRTRTVQAYPHKTDDAVPRSRDAHPRITPCSQTADYSVGVPDKDYMKTAEAKRRLRAALDGVTLLPDTTSDERQDAGYSTSADAARDAELRRNVPPHHGEKQ